MFSEAFHVIVWLTTLPDGALELKARLEGPELLGDTARVLRPGDSLFGYTYDTLAAMGDGEHDVVEATQDRSEAHQ